MKMGWEIAKEAFDAFDKWISEHEEELEDLDMLQIVDVYAKAMSQQEAPTEPK